MDVHLWENGCTEALIRINTTNLRYCQQTVICRLSDAERVNKLKEMIQNIFSNEKVGWTYRINNGGLESTETSKTDLTGS
mgnify:CR=1 FL=1